jgi:hypothetical protein
MGNGQLGYPFIQIPRTAFPPIRIHHTSSSIARHHGLELASLDSNPEPLVLNFIY